MEFIKRHKVWSVIVGLLVVGAVGAVFTPDKEATVPVASSAPTVEPTVTASPTEAPIEQEPMPDVIGWSRQDVTDKLEQSLPYDWTVTLDIGVSYKNGADGTVLASRPNEGEPVQDGDTITVQIAYPFMPNLVGKNPTSANQLKRIGFDVKIVKKVGSPVGKIIAQEPNAGAKALPGEDVVTLTVAKAPPLTVSQENAIESAESYLRFSAFSRQGLIDQLSSRYGEGFPLADAIFAVDHIKVNWNEQAVESAKDYLKFSSFSCQGLIEQLESSYGEGFTHEQAVYGATQTGLC